MWKYYLFLVSLLILGCGAFLPTDALPTRTPLPTLSPTPPFVRWDAAQVMRAIKDAGLEHRNPHFMQPEEFGSIPPLARQGVRFAIPSVCAECGGLVLSFDDPAALQTTKAYYTEATAQNNADLSAWVFEKDNILLHLSGQLTEAQALRYGAVLVRLENN